MHGSFVIDYKRVGNTYDLPNSVWALSRVDLYDGLLGDGPDSTSTAFDYEAGQFNRNEREFYGFGKVITKDLDTDHGGVYRTTEDDYFTDNYYDKGLLKSTVLKDANGNKFTEVVNTFDLKDISSGATLPDAFAQTDDAAAFPALVKTYKLFYQGQAAYFIRLGGCDVGCVWCDVKESWDASAYPVVAVADIVTKAAATGAPVAVSMKTKESLSFHE